MKSFIENLAVRVPYTGEQLCSLHNYRLTKIKGDSITVSIGEMDVNTSHLVDAEDQIAADYIWSPRAINFLIEIFHIGIETAVLYQRAFMSICTQTLKDLVREKDIKNILIKLDGDDIMINYQNDSWKKLSVSIATVSHVSSLIHAGINIDTDMRIPVPAIGLLEILDIDTIENFIYKVTDSFVKYVEDVKLAAVKVRGV